MRQADLKPAGELARRMGVKSVIYGPPGSGKTPVINTAPRPVLLAVEPGLLSMRNSNVMTYEAYTVPRILEFFQWFFGSNESRNFDTLAIDSGSQIAEDFLSDELRKKTDKRALYGNMSDRVMSLMNQLYHLPQKHIVIICKQDYSDVNGVVMKRPKFPGQDLHTKIPHLFDLVMHYDTYQVPGVGDAKALRCWGGYDTTCRDRSGRLAEFEQPNLTQIINKIMQD